MISAVENIKNKQIEIKLLLEAVSLKYGYDFKNYSFAHLKRRLENRLNLSDMDNFSQMQHRLIYDESFFNLLLLDLSINVTEMFRDPWVYKKIRGTVIPVLKTYPYIKVWHAGCSTGQEVYSMAILLEEEDMKKRAQLYATDFNELILSKAKEGIYPMDAMREYINNYQKSGGKKDFSDYYAADYSHAVIKCGLRDKILFSSHNLVTDGAFGEMNLIFCRNVLIYFNKELQDRVLKLFHDSLCPGGFLCLGTKESVKFSGLSDAFEIVCDQEKIYRKRR
jgi:chemotaxis protein methyltransferase CheR